MKKDIILFDIDGTLTDTKSMAEIFYKKLSEIIGVSTNEIIKMKDDYKLELESYTDYHPKDLLEFINKKTNKEIKFSQSPFEDDLIYKNYIYPEVFDVLKKISEQNILGIFSEGFNDYQSKKISGIIDFFDNDLIYIERRKLNDDVIKKLPNGVCIIDDKKEVVEKLNEMGRFNLIWLNRNTDEKMEGIRTIRKLDELIG